MSKRTTKTLQWLLAASLLSWGLAACGGGGGGDGGSDLTCGDGTTAQNGTCVPTGTSGPDAGGGSSADAGSGSGLSCGSGTVEEDGECVAEDPGGNPDAGGTGTTCGDGTEKNDQGECVPTGPSLTCGNGTSAENGTCVVGSDGCGSNATLQNGKCVPDSNSVCANGAEWDSNNNQCVAVSTCGDKAKVENGTCVPDLAKICSAQGDAVEPGPNGENCVVNFDNACGDGTSNDNGKCVPEATCQDGDTVVNGKCVSPAEKIAANADVTESEPNDPSVGGSANDLQFQSGNTVSFTGTLEAPTDRDGDNEVEQDVDVYKFTASQAGQWFKITVRSTGAPEIGFEVKGPDGWTREGALDYPHSTPSGQDPHPDPTRQIYVPAKGDYTLEVKPSSSILNSNAGPFGGPKWGYAGKVEKVSSAPSASQLDLKNKDATGEAIKLGDNLYELTNFSSGTLVELTAKSLGGSIHDAKLQIWKGSTPFISKEVEEGDNIRFPFPSTSGNNEVFLLIDAVGVRGADDGFTITGKQAPSNDIGSIGNDSKKTSSVKTIAEDATETYTFEVGGGQIVEISHTNPGENDELDFSVKNTQLEEVATRDGLDPRNDFSPEYMYFYAETGGTFILDVTNTDFDDISDVELHVKTMTPNDLGSGQPGDTLSGQTSTTVKEDRSFFHMVTLSQAATLKATISPGSAKEFGIVLRDSSFNEVAEEGAFSATSSLSLEVARAEAGVYLLEVKADEELSSHSGEVTLSTPPLAESEPNNTQSNATTLPLDRGMLGDSSKSDSDVYKVSLSNQLGAEETLVVDIGGDFSNGGYTCSLMDGSGNTVDSTSKHDDGCILLAGGLQSGDYFVNVEIDDSEATPYKLQATKKTGTLESEPNDQQSKATALEGQSIPNASSKSAYGELTTSSTKDVFSFQLSSQVSGLLSAEFEFLGPDPVDNDEFSWTVTDSNGNKVLASDGSSAASNPGQGTYYLEVSVSSQDVLTEDNGTSGDLKNAEYRAAVRTFTPDKTKSNTGLGKTIPDDDSAGVTDSLSVSGCGTVQGVGARVKLDHTKAGDINLELTNTGTGDTVTLLEDGDAEDNQFGTRFYLEANSVESLSSTFNGKSGNGSWELEVSDRGLDFGGPSDGEGGTFKAWTLYLRCN